MQAPPHSAGYNIGLKLRIEWNLMAASQPGTIRLVAGLGNPGESTPPTRHNAGFRAVDELARQAGVTYWKNRLGAEVAVIRSTTPRPRAASARSCWSSRSRI